MGIVFAFSDMTLNVFNHYDRIVDDQAGGERDAEQCQCVDGETE